MRFSIIVPVYNCEPFIKQCIESILEQSFRDYELILIDDGSTDGSGAICDNYAEIDNRVRVIHKKNGGANSARKAAVHLINGNYVLNVDGDDFIGEDYLQVISDKIDVSDADMIAWGYTRCQKNGEKLFSLFNRTPNGLYIDQELDLIRKSYLYDPETDEINEGSLLYNLANKAIKNDIYKLAQLQVPDGMVEAEDASTVWLMLKSIKSLFVFDLDKYFYRLNSGSVTAKVNETTIKQQKQLEDFLIEHTDNKWQLKQVRGFLFYRVIFILDRAVKEGYRNCTKLMKIGEKVGIYDQCVMAEIRNISKGNALRRYLIKKRCWILLYIYHRLRSSSKKASNS